MMRHSWYMHGLLQKFFKLVSYDLLMHHTAIITSFIDSALQVSPSSEELEALQSEE